MANEKWHQPYSDLSIAELQERVEAAKAEKSAAERTRQEGSRNTLFATSERPSCGSSPKHSCSSRQTSPLTRRSRRSKLTMGPQGRGPSLFRRNE